MQNKLPSSKPDLPVVCRICPVVIGVFLCIVAVTAGSLALNSCATGPGSHQKNEQTLSVLSNQVASLRQGAVYLPPPANGIVEALLAAAAAALAAWNTHLHTKVRTLANGKSTPP